MEEMSERERRLADEIRAFDEEIDAVRNQAKVSISSDAYIYTLHLSKRMQWRARAWILYNPSRTA